jgi:hypothetical protein
MYDIDALPDAIYLGKQNDDGATILQFDVSAWLEDYATATFAISVTRPTETTASAVVGTAMNDEDDTILEWTVSDTDTEIAGKGWAEIVMTDTGVEKHSKTFATLISSGLTVTA